MPTSTLERVAQLKRAIEQSEYFRGQPLLRRAARIRSYHRNHPRWERLLGKDFARWQARRAQVVDGTPILVATSVGSQLGGTTMESMLAVALTLRGANVEILLCDETLPACSACWYDIFPDLDAFSKFGPKKDCRHCYPPARKMYEALGFTVHAFGDHMPDADLAAARRLVKTTPSAEIPMYTADGIAVGEHAHAGALRFFARGDLAGEAFADSILRRYFLAAVLAAGAVGRLLAQHRFETAVFHHGIYVPQGLVGEVCRRHGVNVANWNPAWKTKCFIFSHGDTYHRTMISEPVSNWQDLVWTRERESRLKSYLSSRWYGSEDWIWFQHESPSVDLDEIARTFGIDFDRPCVGLLTSVMWDAALHYESNAFSTMLEWILYSIQYFCDRPGVQLLIRIHPAEIRGGLPSRQLVAEEIAGAFRELPPNIIVIPPEHSVSTYAVMARCNAVAIYNTKMGIELAAAGIPVIVAGEAWIRNKGFAIDVESPDAYRRILDALPCGDVTPSTATLDAMKYAYHFFFRRMIPVTSIEPVPGNTGFRVAIAGLDDLEPGQCAGLDTICRGIADGSPFIYDGD